MSLIQTSTCLKRQVKKHSWPPTIFGIWISDLLREITGPVHNLEHLELQSIWCVSMELWNPEEMNSDRASTASVKARMEAGSPDRLNRKHSGAADSPVLVFSPTKQGVISILTAQFESGAQSCFLHKLISSLSIYCYEFHSTTEVSHHDYFYRFIRVSANTSVQTQPTLHALHFTLTRWV